MKIKWSVRKIWFYHIYFSHLPFLIFSVLDFCCLHTVHTDFIKEKRDINSWNELESSLHEFYLKLCFCINILPFWHGVKYFSFSSFSLLLCGCCYLYMMPLNKLLVDSFILYSFSMFMCYLLWGSYFFSIKQHKQTKKEKNFCGYEVTTT